MRNKLLEMGAEKFAEYVRKQKKLLLTVHQNPTVKQRVCVARWARHNGLKAVFVNMNFPQEPST